MPKLTNFSFLMASLALIAGMAQASNDPVRANPNTGANFNRYAYANNNPYRFTDPDGRQSRDLENEYRVSGAKPPSGGNGPSLLGWALTEVACGFCNLNYTAPSGSGAVQPIVTPMEGSVAGGAARGASALASAIRGAAASGTANPVPATMARVVPNGVPATSLGPPSASDVFVTAADDIAGMNSAQVANRLTIKPSQNGFQVFEFRTPQSGVASPVLRTDPGFVGGGRTAGGAREFVIPNGPIPPDATVRTLP